MSKIKIESVVSVSSEDADNRASNLLECDSSKKWLCASLGETSINAVFQLASLSKIVSVEIQNANTAFVEMLVARSADAETFKPFLLTSMLMSLKEAKSGENTNGTKVFKEIFSDATRDEKWDRVKFVCSQPYNKNSKFGLSRIVLHSDEDHAENLDFGRFQIKASNEQTPLLQAGGLFARRNQTTALLDNKPAAKSPAKKVITVNPVANGLSPIKNQTKPSLDDILTSDDSDNDPHYVPSKDSDDEFKRGSKDKPKSPRIKKKKDPTPQRPKVPKVDTSKTQPQKSFNKFMENVVFAISGFQNPLRGEIRSKAISMGAKYKPDWDSSCTHLICAFANTPKYLQVRGQGKIVKKEWIEQSYDRRILFPWRRYALDPNEIAKPESDSEIYEERDLPLRVDNRRTVNESDSADTEEEIERVRKRANAKKEVKKPEPTPGPSTAQDPSIYDMDTEEEEFLVENNPDSIPNLFDSNVFLLLDDLDLKEREKLRRYIIAHKGLVADEEEDLCQVDYVISEKAESVAMVKKELENIIGLYPEWIYRCHDEKRLLPISKYELK